MTVYLDPDQLRSVLDEYGCKVHRLQPGDVVVIETDRKLSPDAMQRIQDVWKAATDDAIKAVVLTPELRVSRILRESEA